LRTIWNVTSELVVAQVQCTPLQQLFNCFWYFSLRSYNVSGKIPVWLPKQSNLTHLDLSDNDHPTPIRNVNK